MRYGNGLPVAFHIDVTTQGQLPGIDDYQGRAGVLYHRYDGHYGLISPAG